MIETQRDACPPGYSFSGPQLAAARKANNLSLWRLSMRLTQNNDPVSPETLRTWELGIAEPRVTTFFILARILRRLPHSFFRPYQENQPPAPSPPGGATDGKKRAGKATLRTAKRTG